MPNRQRRSYVQKTDLIKPNHDPIAFVRWLDDVPGLVLDTRNRDHKAVDFEEAYRHVSVFDLPELVDAQTLQERIDSGEFDELIETIAAGYERVWDGRNHVAQFDEEASDALEELEQLLSNAAQISGDHVGIWDPYTWFNDFPPEVSPATTDEELCELAGMLEEKYGADGIVFENLFGYLEELREETRARLVTP
jgi:hypothetical protein